MLKNPYHSLPFSCAPLSPYPSGHELRLRHLLRVLGFKGLRVLGSEDIRVLESKGLRVLWFEGLRVIGSVGLRVLGS